MKNTLVMCLLMILILLSSCANDNAMNKQEIITLSGNDLPSDLSGKEYKVNSNTEIIIKNANPYSLYGFFPIGNQGTSSGRSVISTNGGTKLLYTGSEGNPELHVSAKDIGIISSSNVKVVSFQPEKDRFSTDPNTENPIGVIDGYEVFEKFFLADTNMLPDKSNVTLLTMWAGSVSEMSSQRGILIGDGLQFATGIVDLSSQEKAGLYQQRRIQINDYNSAQREKNNLLYEEIKLVTPIMIEKDSPIMAKTSSCYMIGSSIDELVLEIDLGDTNFNDLSLKITRMNARYKTGKRYPYIFPSAITSEGKILLYIGYPDDDIIFDYCTTKRKEDGCFDELSTTFTLRVIQENEKSFFEANSWDMSETEKTIILDEQYYNYDIGYGIIPIIFKGENLENIRSIRVNSDLKSSSIYYLGGYPYNGWFSTVLKRNEDNDLRNSIPEYAYILFRKSDIGKTVNFYASEK